MSKKPTVLMILDGYGLSDKTEGNAVKQAKTPVMDKLIAKYPFVQGEASGMAVGLPDGQMGNSEVGHTNMGAGRIVYQMLVKISKSIQDGDFFENKALVAAMENCKKNDSALHLMGLLSPGGVHSHMEHLYGLLEMAKKNYQISTFSKHHDQVGEKLTELKNIIIKYCPAKANENLLNAALFDIYACEAGLESHCKVEDYIFVPAILKLERRIRENEK